MLFKNIYFLMLWWPFCSTQPNHLCKDNRGHDEEHFCEMKLNLDQWYRRRYPLKTFLIQCSGNPLSSGVHLCSFGLGLYEERFFEIILNFDQWLRRKSYFFIWSSGSPFDWQSGTICAILVEGIMRNTSV